MLPRTRTQNSGRSSTTAMVMPTVKPATAITTAIPVKRLARCPPIAAATIAKKIPRARSSRGSTQARSGRRRWPGRRGSARSSHATVAWRHRSPHARVCSYRRLRSRTGERGLRVPEASCGPRRSGRRGVAASTTRLPGRRSAAVSRACEALETVPGLGWILDRPPDDIAEVRERNLERDQEEEDVPEHGAQTSQRLAALPSSRSGRRSIRDRRVGRMRGASCTLRSWSGEDRLGHVDRGYEDPRSTLSQRLVVVRRAIGDVLRAREGTEVRAVSICAGRRA